MCYCDGRVLKDVLNGNFPTKTVMELKTEDLERLVSKLIQYTIRGAEDSILGPDWWPKSVCFEKYMFNRNGEKRAPVLQWLVLKCSKFYRDFTFPFSHPFNSLFDVENMKLRSKRKHDRDDSDIPEKRRKTVPLTNVLINNQPVVKLHNIFSRPNGINLKKSNKVKHLLRRRSLFKRQLRVQLTDVVRNPPKSEREEFFSYMGLAEMSENVSAAKPHAATNNYLRYGQQFRIPISSTLGQLVLRKDHPMTESVILNRISRTERFVNTRIPRVQEQTFEVSYVPRSKFSSWHYFKFPVRYRRDRKRAYLLGLCKSLTVNLIQTDLLKEREKHIEIAKKNRNKRLIVVLERIDEINFQL